jgi:hypothetical protein
MPLSHRSRKKKIFLSANPLDGGQVFGSGKFLTGSIQTVKAIPNSGYDFTNWTEDNIVVSTVANYSFPLMTNRTLVANFTVVAPPPSDGGGLDFSQAIDSAFIAVIT